MVDSTNTTTTRRALLATAPALAATAIPAAATTAPIAVGTDPVFAVIERHWDAWNRHSEAWLHTSQMEDEHGDPEAAARIFLYEIENKDMPDGTYSYYADNYREIEMRADCRFFCREDRRRDVAEREAWIVAKKKELDAAIAAREERRPTHPAHIAYLTAREIDGALGEATAALLNTPPTTVSGVAAVLAHLARVNRNADDAWQFVSDDDLQKLLLGLATMLNGETA